MSGSPVYSIFVDVTNTIYVANQYSGPLQVWIQGVPLPILVNVSSAFSRYALFTTINSEIYINSAHSNNSVDIWMLNTTSKIDMTSFSGSCTGLFIDLNNTLYCSIEFLHRVFTKSLINNTNKTATVAGRNSSAFSSNALNGPQGIFVHINFTLFVADMNNDRIQQFNQPNTNGTTAAGNSSFPPVSLNRPTAVVLDGSGYFFIVDSGNNRVVGSDMNGFRCVAGCTNTWGSAANQLNYPRSLSFDSDGNIYVVDVNNSRVQQFNLTTISPCRECLSN